MLLEPSRKPRMKLFHKHNQGSKTANYLFKITPPQEFHCALNAPPERKIVWKIKVEN